MRLHSILVTANSVVRIAVQSMKSKRGVFQAIKVLSSPSMLALWCCDHGRARLAQANLNRAQILEINDWPKHLSMLAISTLDWQSEVQIDALQD